MKLLKAENVQTRCLARQEKPMWSLWISYACLNGFQALGN